MSVVDRKERTVSTIDEAARPRLDVGWTAFRIFRTENLKCCAERRKCCAEFGIFCAEKAKCAEFWHFLCGESEMLHGIWDFRHGKSEMLRRILDFLRRKSEIPIRLSNLEFSWQQSPPHPFQPLPDFRNSKA